MRKLVQEYYVKSPLHGHTLAPTLPPRQWAGGGGAEFEDKYGLLRGVGKVSKHVKLKDVKDINKIALRYYIKQALALNKS